MAQQHITTTFTPDEFDERIAAAVERTIRPLIEAAIQPPSTPKLLTRQQTARFLGISLPTLHDWTMHGKITANRIGTRVRYYQTDVEAALQRIKTAKN
ncbi:helix-turn-helix domain-containing protein [Runella aurantiaca]|uniref:DNA-binding protein n=1 Tax=Runella aurantiaca TaxID=2282308 RepID=A0A369IG85_9BACT|nr:helix-turn-helix domain-containing protein [Runella aurantiaca]RDB07790.1 DNA-binding protein [Runella aurantiaca]